ncbi:division/cell wall cluster transcriptional repressor MraZ [Patescibacteria group bacterium]|nr:division/cell wall cluster transcriptional repressor MraZ [Patescibacteria group bacterium]
MKSTTLYHALPAIIFMLIGQYLSKLTDKDRVAIPKKIRQELGEGLVIARWYENCLVLVSIDSWQKLLTRLTGKSKLITSPVRDIDRFILGLAFEIKLDAQGRFIMPKILLNYANIKEDVVFVGLGDRVEVWSIEEWQKLEASVEKKAAEAIEKIAKTKF